MDNRLKSSDLTIRLLPAKRKAIEALALHHVRSLAWVVDQCLDAHLPAMLAQVPDAILQAVGLSEPEAVALNESARPAVPPPAPGKSVKYTALRRAKNRTQ